MRHTNLIKGFENPYIVLEELKQVARDLGRDAKQWREDKKNRIQPIEDETQVDGEDESAVIRIKDENGHIIKSNSMKDIGLLKHRQKQETSPLDGKERLSPVTYQDFHVSDQLVEALLDHENGKIKVPVISEEQNAQQNHEICNYAKQHARKRGETGPTYWVIDPIDGTANFIDPDKKNYSVLVGLVENGEPTFGIAYYPEYDKLLYSWQGKAYEQYGDEPPKEVRLQPYQTVDGRGKTQKVNVSSRIGKIRGEANENDPAYAHLPAKLKDRNFSAVNWSVGKIINGEHVDMVDYSDDCQVLDGIADIGYYSGGGFEWDFGARQAIVEAAGGAFVYAKTGERVTYGENDQLYCKPAQIAHPKTFQALGKPIKGYASDIAQAV